MPIAEEVRLRHMLAAAEKIMEFAKERTRQDLDADEMLALSIVRLLEIVGEAAKSISDSTRALNPTVQWSAIGRTRDRLIHAYFDVDYDIIWEIVDKDIPPLVAALKSILP